MNKITYGQWIGTSVAENGVSGLSVINIEKRSATEAQVIGISPQTNLRMSGSGTVNLLQEVVAGEVSHYHVFDNQSGWISLGEYWKQHRLPGMPPTKVAYKAKSDDLGEVITGTGENDLGLKSTFAVSNLANRASKAADETMNWRVFKNYIGKFRGKYGMYFRGQRNNRSKLRTVFHRSGRNNILRYFNEDIPLLASRINAVSKHVYDLRNLHDSLALMGLAQHHGYPTPLLDWTRSPYIAAFFAFDLFTGPAIEQDYDSDEKVRVFIIDGDKWSSLYPPLLLTDPWPQINFMELPAHNNQRYFPQQAVASFTNIDDLESYVEMMEKRSGENFLTIIDLPLGERREVFEELQSMGITSTSLFPGYDGICNTLRLQFFR